MKKHLKKPEKQTKTYYDWIDAWEYLKEKYGFPDECAKDEDGEPLDLWQYFCDKYEIHNGGFISVTDWELKHNDGEFAYMYPDWYIPILNVILDEFGEVDKECLTPNTRVAEFQTVW